MLAEQVELPRGVGVAFRCDGFVVAADLGEVARLEFRFLSENCGWLKTI
jgi:hypothetical protein